jgi:uncharacterized membrane protein (UPF0127 family)
VRTYSFRNTDEQSSIAHRVTVAATSKQRREGLLRSNSLESSAGLWIVPCEAIHTFFMKFAIDAVFLDRGLRVTSIKTNLRPFRIACSLRAHSVLELPVGAVARSRTKVGHRFQCSPEEDA